jgi:aspartate/methionine/tyrosine aminotransferase
VHTGIVPPFQLELQAQALPKTMEVSTRAESVASFKVMEVLARAAQLEREGASIMHLEVGQPQVIDLTSAAHADLRHVVCMPLTFQLVVLCFHTQTGAPQGALDAAATALSSDRIGYTEALGVLPLRQRICKHYTDEYSIEVEPSRIAVTTGSRCATTHMYMPYAYGICVALCFLYMHSMHMYVTDYYVLAPV